MKYRGDFIIIILLALVAYGAVFTLTGSAPHTYNVTCYDPSIVENDESPLLSRWMNMDSANCDAAICTMRSHNFTTTYKIPDGMACSVEQLP